MKRVLTILLTAVMIFTFGFGSFAADPQVTTGSITISNTTIGQVYTLHRIFDATIYDTNVTENTAIAYTYSGSNWNEEVEKYFSKDAANYIRVKEGAYDSTGHLTSAAITALATLATDENVVSTQTATANTLTVSGLDFGYYYVTSTLKTAVSIDSTTPNATIIDKNQAPSWYDAENQKTDPAGVGTDPSKSESERFVELGKFIVTDDGSLVTTNDANYGDTVNFVTSFNATNYYYEEQVRTYYLYDTVDPGFDLDTTNTSYTVKVDGVTLTQGTQYLLSFKDTNKVGKNDTFQIAIFWDDADGNPIYQANAKVEVSYKAVVNNEAVLTKDANYNTTTFDFRVDSDKATGKLNPSGEDLIPLSPLHQSDERKTKTYVYALGLTKLDGTTKEKIKGAEFKLTRDGVTIKADETDVAGVYEYNANGSVTQFETDDNGMLVIKGLTRAKYILTEEVAPKGYNRYLAEKEIEFLVDDRDSYVPEHSVYYDEDGEVLASAEGAKTTVTTNYGVNVLSVFLENERGVELPITGGIGTTLFYIIGGILILIAVVLLITKKRMKAEK